MLLLSIRFHIANCCIKIQLCHVFFKFNLKSRSINCCNGNSMMNAYSDLTRLKPHCIFEIELDCLPFKLPIAHTASDEWTDLNFLYCRGVRFEKLSNESSVKRKTIYDNLFCIITHWEHIKHTYLFKCSF